MNGVNGVEQDAEAGKARWTRCGCWPNAVVRRIDMSGSRRRKKKGGIGKGKRQSESRRLRRRISTNLHLLQRTSRIPILTFTFPASGAGADMDSNTDETTLSFAESSHCTIYALTKKSCWGGNETMDMLPALMESQGCLGASLVLVKQV